MFSDVVLTESMFRSQTFSVEDVINMLKSGKLMCLSGKETQRWNTLQKCTFIRSCLYLPITDYLLIDGSKSIWYLLVGDEEICAIDDYLKGVLTETLDSGEKTKFQLSLIEERKLWQKKFSAIIVNPGTSSLARWKIYKDQMAIHNRKENLNYRKVVFPYENFEF